MVHAAIPWAAGGKTLDSWPAHQGEEALELAPAVVSISPQQQVPAGGWCLIDGSEVTTSWYTSSFKLARTAAVPATRASTQVCRCAVSLAASLVSRGGQEVVRGAAAQRQVKL